MFERISRVPFLYKLVLLAAGLAVVFGVFASPAKAQSTADLQRMIEQLMQQIAQLKAQAELDGIREQVDSCPSLTYSLKFGDTDGTTEGEVSQLQTFLVKKYGLSRADYVTGYFGMGTRGLVNRFQSEKGLTPVGIVGPQTRTKIAEACLSSDALKVKLDKVHLSPDGDDSIAFTYDLRVTATGKAVTVDLDEINDIINDLDSFTREANGMPQFILRSDDEEAADLKDFSAKILVGKYNSGEVVFLPGQTMGVVIFGSFTPEDAGDYYVDLSKLRTVERLRALGLALSFEDPWWSYKTGTLTIGGDSAGIDVDVFDTDATAQAIGNGSSIGKFTIEFDVTALDNDYYIESAINGGVRFVIEDSSGNQAVGTTTAVLSSTADEEYSGTYIVDEGSREDFTLTIVFEPVVTGSYRARMTGLQYGLDRAATTNLNLFPESEYRTSYVSLVKETGGATINCGKLLPGKSLTPGQSLTSCDKSHTLRFQTDGNLVVYKGSTALWASNTVGKGSTRLSMQTDGNIVIYAGSKAVWSLLSYVGGKMGTGQYLHLKDDGTLAVYNQKGEVRWSTSMPLKTATGSPTVTTILPKNGSSAYEIGDTIPMKWEYSNIPANSQIIAKVELLKASANTGSISGGTWQSEKISGTGSLARSSGGLITGSGYLDIPGTYRLTTKVRQCNAAGCNFYYASNESLPVSVTGSVVEFTINPKTTEVEPATPTTPTGTITATPCVIGSAPSKFSTRTDVCDSTITWSTQNATKAYTSITGSSPYLKSIYPYGYTTPGGNKLSGTNVPFWTPAGTYTVSLYVNGDYSNSKTTPNTGTKIAEKTITVLPKDTSTSTDTTCGKLLPGKYLTPGQSITSCSGAHTATFTTDGNFTFGGWNSNTAGKGGTKLTMQTDGNLVIYAGGKALWSLLSHDGGKMGTGQYLELKNDGTLAVYDAKGSVRWSTSMPFKAVGSISAITPEAPKPTGSISVTTCTPGLGKSAQSPDNALTCDITFSWSTKEVTNAYAVIRGDLPYDSQSYPLGFYLGEGTTKSGTPLWVTNGTYTITLYGNGFPDSSSWQGSAQVLDTKTFTISTPAASRNTLNQMASVLEAIRSLLGGWR